jgi:hypothetical protein
LHLAQYEHPESTPISADTIRRAITIGTYFHHHARILFRLMYGRHGQSDAAAILDVLQTIDGPSITKRDLYQRVRSRAAFQAVDNLNDALDTLEDYGWIRRVRQTGPKGGRPSELVRLNPRLGTQNTQNLHSATPVPGSGNIEGVPLTNAVPRNVTPLHPEHLDRTGTDDTWTGSMDL